MSFSAVLVGLSPIFSRFRRVENLNLPHSGSYHLQELVARQLVIFLYNKSLKSPGSVRLIRNSIQTNGVSIVDSDFVHAFGRILTTCVSNWSADRNE